MVQREIPLIHARRPIREHVRHVARVSNSKCEVDIRPAIFTIGSRRSGDRSACDALVRRGGLQEFRPQTLAFLRSKHSGPKVWALSGNCAKFTGSRVEFKDGISAQRARLHPPLSSVRSSALLRCLTLYGTRLAGPGAGDWGRWAHSNRLCRADHHRPWRSTLRLRFRDGDRCDAHYSRRFTVESSINQSSQHSESARAPSARGNLNPNNGQKTPATASIRRLFAARGLI